MPGLRIQRTPLLLAALLVLGTLAIVFYSGSGTPANGVDCEHWCGSGSATVTIGGVTTTINGGGCYDQGSAGVDARFGDWQGVNGESSYLTLTAYRVGGPTPTPVPTIDLSASPAATEYPLLNVSGSVAGNPFVLDANATVGLGAGGDGTYSGTDLDGAGRVTGTFTCH